MFPNFSIYEEEAKAPISTCLYFNLNQSANTANIPLQTLLFIHSLQIPIKTRI